ncbi:hypothetical protein F5878DRAFT_4257 [Lentinula raphanica]|uniref:Fungal N-terminal domain-containing protein n=1 Tax=Lentinula raphanica TaxID=153919 RepID=A0AA38PL48_9AGAR|nr:hypothetical protein F5878DRAFT_4257 [Lentinula raphanica]
MAEIIGTISSVISLAELASTAIRYLKAIKNANKECLDIVRELKILEAYVVDLKNLLSSQSHVEEDWAQSLSALDGQGGPLRELIFLLKNLETRVKPKKRFGMLKKRVAWAIYSKEETMELLKCIERVTVILKAAIQLDALKLDIAIKKDIEDMREAVDGIQAGIDSLDVHANFQTTLMVKTLEANSFGHINRSRDHGIDSIEIIRKWLYCMVASYTQDGMLVDLAGSLLSSSRMSNFSKPQHVLSEGNAFRFRGWLNSISVEDFGHNVEHAFTILLQLDDVLRWNRYALTKNGVSLAWKCLHDVTTRRRIPNTSHFSLFQTVLAEDGQKLVASINDRWHFVSFTVCAKWDFVNWFGGFFLSCKAGEKIHIFGVHSEIWYGISETSYLGYVCPRHVSIVDWEETVVEDIIRWSPKELWSGMDIRVQARRACQTEGDTLLMYKAGDIIHVLHSADYQTPTGGFVKHWYGYSEADTRWGFVDPENFDQLPSDTDEEDWLTQVVKSTQPRARIETIYGDGDLETSDDESFFTASLLSLSDQTDAAS